MVDIVWRRGLRGGVFTGVTERALATLEASKDGDGAPLREESESEPILPREPDLDAAERVPLLPPAVDPDAAAARRALEPAASAAGVTGLADEPGTGFGGGFGGFTALLAVPGAPVTPTALRAVSAAPLAAATPCPLPAPAPALAPAPPFSGARMLFALTSMKGLAKKSWKDIRMCGLRVSKPRSNSKQGAVTTKPSGSRNSCLSMFCKSSMGLDPVNGGRLATISNRMAPTDHKSALASYF
mmetsp:Transcript_53932/g.109715  ORF Transcript_53932/g.109715 Transcript_53932/m.109715 type:complete len:242 (+) Transcript_53932:527-1252(+)